MARSSLACWIEWLAEDDGIPKALHGSIDMTEYEAAAAEILNQIK